MHKLNTIIFTSTLTVVLLLNLILPDRTFSDNENRVLASRPTFSMEALISQSYTVDFETYLTDQFAFRDACVEGKMICERLLGKVENNGVYFGRDDYLIERIKDISYKQIQKNIDYTNRFVSTLPAHVSVSMMLVPTAQAILQSKLPYVHDDFDELKALDVIQTKLDPAVSFIPLKDAFLSQPDQDLYFKTDHHFNLNGALIAYKQFLNKDHQGKQQRMSSSFLGTLASKSGSFHHEPDAIFKLDEPSTINVDFHDGHQAASVYFPENLTKKDQYTYYLNGNHPLVTIRTGHESLPKLLIIRDSYANIFSTTLLEDFSEITLVDLRYYRLPVSELITSQSIDQLLFLYSTKNYMTDVNLTFLK